MRRFCGHLRLLVGLGLALAGIAALAAEPPSVPVANPVAASPAAPAAGPAPAGPAAAGPATGARPAIAAGPAAGALPAAGGEAAGASAAVGPITEVKPDVFYIRDKDNRLVAVPGFSYDDFVKYYRLKEHLDHPDVKPRYNLEQMTIVGSAAAGSGRIDRDAQSAACSIQDWVRIPLRMNKCALARAGRLSRGRRSIRAISSPAADGYVCWLRGSPRSEHD